MTWNLPQPVPEHRPRRRLRGLKVAAITFIVAILTLSGVAAAVEAGSIFGHETVGTSDARGILLPSNQRITPLGSRLLVNNGRLLSSSLSPDGRHVAALSWENFTGFVTILDAKTHSIVQQVGTGIGADATLGDATVAADGPFWSPDGKSLWVSQTSDVLRFAVAADGTLAASPVVIPLLDSTGPFLPSGMALSSDGADLYVALNGANTLGVIDTATNTLVRQIKVGIAPRQVVLVGDTAYVSNEGGRRAKPGDTTNLSDNTPVVSDPVTGAGVSGTVSVVDLGAAKQTTSIAVGLQPTALYLDASALMVANSNDDSMSIIDTTRNVVAQTINVNPLPGSTVGSYPNAISMPDPNHILVSIGRDNAIAVYRYNGLHQPVQYEGLIPTDWYPVTVQYSTALHKIIVTNDRGIGARGPASTVTEGPDTNPATGHNTYDDTGSLTSFAPPTEADLAHLTHQVFVDNDWEHLLQSTPLGSGSAAPVPIPVRLGDPSTIKHVFLIVKENRTYDQVLGDLGKGNGDPSLTQFGGSVTPNQHALARRYAAFDNFYDAGTLSADGHNWLMQADANDYIEKEFGAFWRSYPAQGGDALAYQRDGFLWNAAKKAGKTAADFGEYANFLQLPTTGAPTWAQWYQSALVLEGKASGPPPVATGQYPTYSDIPSLNDIIDRAYPKFDTDIPDQYRVDIWKQAFAASEQTGKLANLNLLWLPDDHTAGTSGVDPFPTAQVADNDLALGRIVDTITHSQFWKNSAIFVLEDDSQAGADHIDGHRAPLYVISPYAKRGGVNNTYYSQLNVVKTIEQILGVAPMNQLDRAAEPMTNAFTNTPNTQTYTAMPNQIPLTYGLNPTATTSLSHTTTRPQRQPASAAGSPAEAVPPAMESVYRQWQVWSTHQQFGGATPSEDRANPAQLNRLDWYSSTGWTRPYPGDTSILGPYQVPGWDRPAADLGN